MSMLSSWGFRQEPDQVMARTARPIDIARVDGLVSQLKLTVRDPEAFKTVYAALLADKSLSANEAIEVAYKFIGGFRQKSKKAALAAIGQERLRLAHATAKAESAAKTKTW